MLKCRCRARSQVPAIYAAVDGTAVDDACSTRGSWIRKSDEDKLDGMVHILQHLLQCYAARVLDTTPSLSSPR